MYWEQVTAVLLPFSSLVDLHNLSVKTPSQPPTRVADDGKSERWLDGKTGNEPTYSFRQC